MLSEPDIELSYNKSMREKVLAWLREDFENMEGEIRNGVGGLVYKAEDVDDYINYACGDSSLSTHTQLECVFDALELGGVMSFGEWLDEVDNAD